MNSFKSLDKIAEQIVFYIGQLNSGKLSATQIDQLLAEVGQLQERLIILRYKAFEESLTTEPAESEKATSEEVQMETPIDFSFGSTPTPVVPAQVSLMDIIEEVEQAAIVTADPIVEEEVANEEIEQPIVEETFVAEILETPVEIPNLVSVPETQSSYFAQRSALTDDVTIAERLQKSPIGDLTKAIPLAQKFIFINELFKQNADDYHASIDQLNKFDEQGEAFEFVKNHLMPLYNWRQDDKNVELFMDLVERRFM